ISRRSSATTSRPASRSAPPRSAAAAAPSPNPFLARRASFRTRLRYGSSSLRIRSTRVAGLGRRSSVATAPATAPMVKAIAKSIVSRCGLNPSSAPGSVGLCIAASIVMEYRRIVERLHGARPAGAAQGPGRDMQAASRCGRLDEELFDLALHGVEHGREVADAGLGAVQRRAEALLEIVHRLLDVLDVPADRVGDLGRVLGDAFG